jgi:hypothetical protein
MRLLVEELSADQIAEVERRMRPGTLSERGFLTPRERLVTVIASDEKACAERGIRPEQIADRLETLVGRATRRVSLALAMGGDDTESMIEGFLHDDGEGVSLEGFRLTGLQWRGGQDCPFSHECEFSRYSSADYTLIHLGSGRSINFPGLIFHLIRDHHFFEGKVPGRLDPIRAIDALELQPGIDYAPVYATETRWRPSSSTTQTYEEALRDPGRRLFHAEDARDVFDLAPGVRILWNGEMCIAAADCEHVVGSPLVIGGVTWPAQRLYSGTVTYVVEDETYVV